jgi:hypothetical protein
MDQADLLLYASCPIKLAAKDCIETIAPHTTSPTIHTRRSDGNKLRNVP